MSDQSELTETQIATLRARLGELQDALVSALEDSKAGTEVVSLDRPIGRVSRIGAIQQQKMAAASRRQQELRLGQVRVALAAIDAGEYGECKRCDEPIGLRRLTARPESPLCLRCQDARERGGRAPG